MHRSKLFVLVILAALSISLLGCNSSYSSSKSSSKSSTSKSSSSEGMEMDDYEKDDAENAAELALTLYHAKFKYSSDIDSSKNTYTYVEKIGDKEYEVHGYMKCWDDYGREFNPETGDHKDTIGQFKVKVKDGEGTVTDLYFA